MNDTQPNRFAFRLLRIFCPPHLLEEIEGDLLQLYERDLSPSDRSKRSDGYWRRKAKRRLLWNVLRFFRPGILFRNKLVRKLNFESMLQNHFKIAYRHLTRSKVFTLINVVGLAVGLVAFFLIMQYVSFEFSYDQFYENRNDIYRVAYKQFENGEVKNTSAMNFGGVRHLLKTNFDEVTETTGFSPMPNNLGFLFGYNGKKFLEPGKLLRSDSNFFKVFPSLLVKGEKNLVLKDKHNLVISEKIALKIFGKEDPMGKLIDNLENDEGPYVISGVMKDLPENAHFHADFVNKIDKEWEKDIGTWNDPGFYNYVTLKPGADFKSIESKLNAILQKLEKEKKVVSGATSVFQPITGIHFNSHFQAELESNGNATLVYILLAVGVLIITVAWINYINIETARFTTRASEIGVRRIVGSGKWDLVSQFLVEFFCLNCLAVAIAATCLWLSIPYFSSLIGIPYKHIQLLDQKMWWSVFAFFFFGSLVTGIIPVLFLLKLNPINSLKGKFGSLGKRETFRKSLVAFQFSISILLVAFLLVVTGQLEFLKLSSKNLPVDQVIAIRNPTAYGRLTNFTVTKNEFDALENKLLQNPSIKFVSGSSAIPGTEVGFTFVNLLKRSLADPFSPVRYKMLFVDDGFIPMYGLKLKAGRNFSFKNGEDVDVPTKLYANQPVPKDYYQTLLLNESAVHALGFKSMDEAINQIIYLTLWADDFERYKIVGIVEDYHHESAKKEVLPTIFTFNFKRFQMVYYSIKLQAGSNPKEALAYIEESWKEIFPDKPFDYFFLDDYYDRQFKSEVAFTRIFSLFAGVAMFIAFVGILGMTLFEANSRLKEISIRKVLGATITNLMLMLSKKYFKLIAIAAFVASPLIYFVAKGWLQTYPARIEISPLFFALPIVALVLVVLLASVFQTFKTANTNPIDHLKNE